MRNKDKKAILKSKKDEIKEKGYYSLISLETGRREDHYPIIFGSEITVSLKATEEEIELAREKARKGKFPVL